MSGGARRPLTRGRITGALLVWTLGVAAAPVAEVPLARAEKFPREANARIQKIVWVEAVPPQAWLAYAVDSSDPYVRYLRIYVDGRRVVTRMIQGRASGRVELGVRLQRPGRHRVMFEVDSGSYAQWVLDARLEGVRGRLETAEARGGG